MARGERLDVVLLRNAMLAENKAAGKLTNNVTIKSYKKNIKKFCEYAKKKAIVREGHIAREGYSPQSLLQEYADVLRGKGYSPQTIHSYLAPVCKGLGVGMNEIRKPARNSANIVKNTLQHQNAAGTRQMNDDRFTRISRFAEIVTVRPRALVRLTANNLIQDENGDWLIAARDKGGKISQQLLLPHEVKFVRDMLSHGADGHLLAPDEKPFCKKDLGKIAYSGFRCARAQKMEQHFDQVFNSWRTMPSRTAQQRQARQAAKENAALQRQDWINKICEKWNQSHPKASESQRENYRKRLENPSRIYIRGGNLERARQLGRPVSYDRVATRIASVYALSHWEDESTIRNYLTK